MLLGGYTPLLWLEKVSSVRSPEKYVGEVQELMFLEDGMNSTDLGNREQEDNPDALK